MYICLCNAVTERQIVQAAESGVRSPEDLAFELGVGSGCGHCASCAKALLLDAVAKITGGAGQCAGASQASPA